jgi:uncharacterized iron-regulated protein
MKSTFLACIFLLSSMNLIAQKSLQTYQLYNAKGKKTSFKKMIKSSMDKDMVFFGELHNNPICHWMQMEFTKAINSERGMQIGVEMFERDNEADLQRYLKGKISKEALDTLVRFWGNYETDYQPLLEYAKANQIPYTGTNIPRRYAREVYKNDFEALEKLTAAEKSFIAPLPIKYDPELKPYKDMLSMMGGHGGSTLPKAQAIKDATMAYFILEFWDQKSLFLHINGAYHSDYFSSILWYLEQSQTELDMLTITTVIQEDIHIFDPEQLGKADFYLVIDSDVTTSY